MSLHESLTNIDPAKADAAVDALDGQHWKILPPLDQLMEEYPAIFSIIEHLETHAREKGLSAEQIEAMMTGTSLGMMTLLLVAETEKLDASLDI